MRFIPLIDLLFEVNVLLQLAFFKLFCCEVVSRLLVYVNLLVHCVVNIYA